MGTNSRVINDKQSVNQFLKGLERTTDQIVGQDRLRELLLSGRQLSLKYGVDVTAPELHLGHAVNLWAYRRFQDLGHKVIFLIGSFTTQIGDPTGKNQRRPIVSLKEIDRNAQTFIDQALMVLRDNKSVLDIRRNGEWFDRMSAQRLLQLMSLTTVEHLLSRDMFRQRQKAGQEIYQNELVYPILQGYDSVELKTDITVIGTDQLYNEIMGRQLQAHFEQPPQVIITTKITPGLDGKEKQSKSIGNYVGLLHSPEDKFGRVMTLPDELIKQWFEVYTDIPLETVNEVIKTLVAGANPRDVKASLAREIVRLYHGENAAAAAEAAFNKQFRDKQRPLDLPIFTITKEAITVCDLLVRTELASSKTTARALIEQGGVRINDQLITEDAEIRPKTDDVVQVGKRRFVKLKVE